MDIKEFFSTLWIFLTTRTDWAALATFLAVIVALLPILRDSQRTKSQARNLRLRVAAVLVKLRPSLGGAMLPASHPGRTPEAELSSTEFNELVRDLGILLSQCWVLEAYEHDHLGMVYMNLVSAAKVYGTPVLEPGIAHNLLQIVDKSLEIMENHGLMTTIPEKPWEK